MNFGLVLEEVKKGKKIRRENWNGKGLHVLFVHGSSIQNIITENYGNGIAKETPNVEDFFMIYSKNGLRLNTWVPSVSDVLAEDWEIID